MLLKFSSTSHHWNNFQIFSYLAAVKRRESSGAWNACKLGESVARKRPRSAFGSFRAHGVYWWIDSQRQLVRKPLRAYTSSSFVQVWFEARWRTLFLICMHCEIGFNTITEIRWWFYKCTALCCSFVLYIQRANSSGEQDVGEVLCANSINSPLIVKL